MNKNTIIGIIAIAIGFLILFSQYADRFVVQTEEHYVDVGPLEVTYQKEKTVPMATVVGILIMAGGIIYIILKNKNSMKNR